MNGSVVGDEEGSILPMILGYVVLVLVVIFVCLCATDLRIAQKRLDALAASAALAGADGFVIDLVDGTPRAVLGAVGVDEQARALLQEVAPEILLVHADSPDGVTSQVTISSRWHPPVLALFVPDGVTLVSTATSRTVLQ